MTKTNKSSRPLRVGLVVPHIFMHRDILPNVIFSPGKIALSIADELNKQKVDITLFTPGPVPTVCKNVTADLSAFDAELSLRGDNYIELLKKHTFTFVTLARQVQSELIAKSYQMANDGELDLVHIYTNEEEIAMCFAGLCTKPTLFTHHDPFNFLIKYKSVFPKYRRLNWVSISYSQRESMPSDTNWVGNVYHGLSDAGLYPIDHPAGDYLAYLGRIIQPKGVHLVIKAVLQHNRVSRLPIKLKIAGKHYAGHKKDRYWIENIEPLIDDQFIIFEGFIDSSSKVRQFLGNAAALVVPSLFDEPFGLVCIEALACGTPLLCLDSGALPEIVNNPAVGLVVAKVRNPEGQVDEVQTISKLCEAIPDIYKLNRLACREEYEKRFTASIMSKRYLDIYEKLTK